MNSRIMSNVAQGVSLRSPEPQSGNASATVYDAVADAALAAQALRGDAHAFEQLVRRHEAGVYRMAWRVVRNREDAEDCAQDTFVRAWRALPGFREEGNFRAWVYQIALNCALSRRSRPGAVVELCGSEQMGEVADPRAASPAEASIRREALGAVEQALAEMPGDNAALFQLRYGEQMSVAEIATIVRKKPGAVVVALHRLREKISQIIRGEDTEAKKP
ncbi:MAG: RNA polymerase sigma factor [Candidatus Sumerlaeaceae bacterium]|nr:RNA polymerase sigma factor [Candidatus Sumerlaeaceae bacterium]